MIGKTFKLLTVILLITFSNSFTLFSQEKQSHILVEIEDSLRGIFYFGGDSTWINEQLQLYNEPVKESKIKYKLVKIGKRNFTEGPHAKYLSNENNPIANFKYGDSAFSVFGEKFYTYIGNSSWGYYPEFFLLRVDIILTDSDLWNNKKCNKGHNKGVGKPCEICYEENSEERENQILLLLSGPDTCKHGHNMNAGQACYQCLHSYKMEYDSVYKENYIKDSITRMQEILMAGCNHGHICCLTTFCECCPDSLRQKNVVNPVNDTNKTLTQKVNIGDAPLVSVAVGTVDSDCAHSHDCCSSNCPCCAHISKRQSRVTRRKSNKQHRKMLRKNRRKY